MGRARVVGFILCAWLGGGCSDDAAIGRFPSPDGAANGACTFDSDCGGGLLCVGARCVSPDDLLPPDVEDDIASDRPAATARHLFALSTDSDSVAIIDAVSLAIEAVEVPAGPVALAVIPAREEALVLSRTGRAVTRLSLTSGELVVSTTRLTRRYSRITVSPDARWAVLWTSASERPDEGTEGLIALVSLEPDEGTGPPIELAAGYRHTDVLFRTRGGRSERALIVGKDEVVIVDLDDVAAPAPPRVRLPDAFADVASREVVTDPSGVFILFRSVGTPELAALSVDTATVSRIVLPAVATDLDIVRTGTLAIAALRGIGEVALLPLPAIIGSSLAMSRIPVEGVSAGQVELSPDARFAAVFSGQDASEAVGLLDLDRGELRVIDRLRKQVRAVGVSPTGATLVVIHKPDPGSTVADPYEREVDLDEGYSVIDVARGVSQLKRTRGVPPAQLVYTAGGRHAVVTLSDPTRAVHRADVVDLETLVVESRALASAPLYAGALPTSDRVWITQVHRAGRISFVDAASAELRTVTGYHLNAGIE